MRTTPPMPLPVKRALAKLGGDIKAARLRRRIPTTLMAERAFIARSTLQKVEQGDPAVSLGIYATVLFILGMSERIADLAEPTSDSLGLQLEEGRLPKRMLAQNPAFGGDDDPLGVDPQGHRPVGKGRRHAVAVATSIACLAGRGAAPAVQRRDRGGNPSPAPSEICPSRLRGRFVEFCLLQRFVGTGRRIRRGALGAWPYPFELRLYCRRYPRGLQS